MNKTNDFKYNLPAYSDPVDIEDLNDNFRGIDDALMAGLCKKDYTGNNMGSSDPSARKYAWAPWFEIVNDNEFDVVVTDRNAPVESEEATINIAAGQTFRKYINGRYYMNFYVQDQHDVTFKWFTNAETYINESGGGGGGTGTVTSVSVQGGSGSHLTGSGNPIETSGTITINVDDGYSIPSDNEQTAWDGKAVDIALSIDSSTYVMTAQLKDSAGNLIGTAKTIDLPLETMVVDGEYDSQTQKIKLELKNGNYVEFSVADLVSGLQTELSASNKLDPDYIDYDSSHRAVSDTEKNTWNGKQNALTFDDTPTQNSNNPVKSGGVYSALAGKQASLDQTQLAAVNSGIDQTKVAQISTNQTNILYAIEHGQKNQLNFDGWTAQGTGVTWKLNDDKTITATGTATNLNYIVLQLNGSDVVADSLCDGVHFLSGCPSGGDFDSKYSMYVSKGSYTPKDTGSGVVLPATSETGILVVIRIAPGFAIPSGGLLFKPMICLKAVYDVYPEYQQFGVQNSDLTYLEAEDRAALAEVVDSGAKNKLQYDLTSLKAKNTDGTWNNNAYTVGGITYTLNSDMSISISGTRSSEGAAIFNLADYTPVNGDMMSQGTAGTYNVFFYARGGSSSCNGVGTSPIASSDIGVNRTYAIAVTASGLTVNQRYYPMICTKAAFGVSKAFVPYRPNYDLVAKAVNAQNLYGEFAASTSITFESSLALVTIKRNDSNADNVAVYVVANLRDGLTYKPIISSENIPVTIARDSNNSKNVKITNNGSAYYFYLISRYPNVNL